MKALTNPEQFAANNKANIESLLDLASGFISMTDRLLMLNLNFACGVIEQGMAQTSFLASMHSPQALLSFPGAFVQPLIDRSAAYARGLTEILAEGQHGIGQLVDDRVGALKRTLAIELDHAARSAPGGSEVLLKGMKSALAVGNSAYEGASQAARQLAGMAENNLARSAEVTRHPLIAEKSD